MYLLDEGVPAIIFAAVALDLARDCSRLSSPKNIYIH